VNSSNLWLADGDKRKNAWLQGLSEFKQPIAAVAALVATPSRTDPSLMFFELLFHNFMSISKPEPSQHRNSTQGKQKPQNKRKQTVLCWSDRS
jgi:hypothetical protein